MIPLFEISGDSLIPLPLESEFPGFVETYKKERFPPGSEFVLFAEGTRVGSFLATEAMDPLGDYCLLRPRVRGIVELVPQAAETQDFLAIAEAHAGSFSHGPLASAESDRTQRILSLNLAGEAITAVGARWPSTTILDIRRDIRSLALSGAERPAFAATFVNRDGLALGEAPSQAYSLFILGEGDPSGYRTTFRWFRDYGREGKAAPRLLSYLDWNRDSSEELVLEVFGQETRWFMAIGQRDGRWQVLQQDSCGEPAQAPEASG
jgi:hypothetical protein